MVDAIMAKLIQLMILFFLFLTAFAAIVDFCLTLLFCPQDAVLWLRQLKKIGGRNWFTFLWQETIDWE